MYEEVSFESIESRPKLRHGMLPTNVKNIDKQRWGWTKYGPNNFGYGMVREEGEWYCQCCGAFQPEGMAQYLFPMDKEKKDYLRVCSICKHKQIETKIKKNKFFFKLELVRSYEKK